MSSNKQNKHVCLFGGGGYIGHYVAKRFRDEGWQVLSVDCAQVCEVPGVVNLITDGPHIPNLGRLRSSITAFVHLACPRNKAGVWSKDLADLALRQGLYLSEKLNCPKVYISSMSVYDEPPSEYGEFKASAECVAIDAGFRVVRLGTVLGAEEGMPYRADLALHHIARQYADGAQCWVAERARRHVTTIQEVARRIVNRVSSETTGLPDQVTFGVMSYKDIAPASVRVLHNKQGGPVPNVGGPALLENIVHMCNYMLDFIALLLNKENAPWPM